MGLTNCLCNESAYILNSYLRAEMNIFFIFWKIFNAFNGTKARVNYVLPKSILVILDWDHI